MLFGSSRTLVTMFREIVGIRAAVFEMLDDVRSLKQQVQTMSTAFDNLKAAVAAQTAVDQSAVTLINGIASELKAPDADVQALADQLTAAAAPLAAAITANTPAAAAPASPAAPSGGAPAGSTAPGATAATGAGTAAAPGSASGA